MLLADVRGSPLKLFYRSVHDGTVQEEEEEEEEVLKPIQRSQDS